MKNIILLSILLFSFQYLFSQTDSLKLSDLQTPNSPGFQILDISPSSIERPTNPKEFSFKVLNLVNTENGIPKNFSFEFTPFWIFKHKQQSIYNYLGISESKSGVMVSTGIFRKSSISFASAFSDSNSGTLLKNTNYVAFGFKTNILTIRTKGQNDNINTAILAAAKRIDAFQDEKDIEALEKN